MRLRAWLVLLVARSVVGSELTELDKWRCYVARYPDLRSGYCTNPGDLDSCDWDELADHWATHGYSEGRMIECHAWDTECYLTRYPDIYEGARASTRRHPPTIH